MQCTTDVSEMSLCYLQGDVALKKPHFAIYAGWFHSTFSFSFFSLSLAKTIANLLLTGTVSKPSNANQFASNPQIYLTSDPQYLSFLKTYTFINSTEWRLSIHFCQFRILEAMAEMCSLHNASEWWKFPAKVNVSKKTHTTGMVFYTAGKRRAYGAVQISLFYFSLM